MEEQSERRGATRVWPAFPLRLGFPGGGHWTGRLRDVSLTGVFAEGAADLSTGTLCSVDIPLADENGPRIAGMGIVVRVESGGAAIRFRRIDRDGYHHLRRLLLYNAHDPDAVEAELADHLGICSRPSVRLRPRPI